MNRLLFISALLAILAPEISYSASYDASSTVRYPSPTGLYDFSFEPPLPSQTQTDPDAPDATAGVRAKRYQFAVYRAGTTTPIAVAEYYDVFGTKDQAQPRNPSEFGRELIWSPKEDFVILPPERWPANHSVPPHRTSSEAITLVPGQRLIVNTNTTIPWLSQAFPLDGQPLVWRDRMHVVGTKSDACAPSIYEFNGRDATVSPVMPAAPPEGYRVEKAEGGRLLLRKVLGSCATDDDQKHFHPECVELDTSFGRRAIVPCP